MQDFAFRISTAFAVLGICAAALDIFDVIAVGNVLDTVFGHDLAAVLFGELTGAWLLLAVVFAIVHAIRNRSSATAILQHTLEVLLCVGIVFFLPTY
jgi:hypothetical protein